MATQKYISAHLSSYTHRFAETFVTSWKAEFDEKINVVDLSTPILAGQARMRSEKANLNRLFLDGEERRVLYAFHPQSSYQSAISDLYDLQSKITTYATVLTSARCPNLPLSGSWGLHLSFIRARRLLFDCGFSLEPVARAERSMSDRPSIRPYQTFLLPNLISSPTRTQEDVLVFPELTPGWEQEILFTQVIGDHVHHFGVDGRARFNKKPIGAYRKLQRLLDQNILELIESPQGGVIGIHPCLTRFPGATLRCLQADAERT